MKQKEIKLWHQVDEILWNDWDPIGVNDSEEARDEYYSYISSIMKLLKSNCDSYKLSNHLHQLRTNSIGLCESLEEDQKVAKQLIKETENMV